jgi:transcription antitermination protein NusB
MRLTKRDQRLRRRARARTLQALYAWEVADSRSLASMAERVWDDLRVGTEEREVATPLIRTLESRMPEIDANISAVTTNWRLERLGVVERSLLRVAAAELARGETPPKTVIREAVLLAERFASVDSAHFVNGVLDALARRMGRL